MITRALDDVDLAGLRAPWSSGTTASGAAAGAWGSTRRASGRHKTPEQNRSEKEARVRAGRAHAALVFDGATCVGWCQFGPVDELPRIKHKRAYLAGRRACRTGASRASSSTSAGAGRACRRRARRRAGADRRLGGGTVESYPEDVGERKVSASFLHNGTLAMFEHHGFERTRPLGKHHWVVSRVVAASG